MSRQERKLCFESLLQVKYIKLHFTLQIAEDSMLPVYKASALRGGMGEMLLRVNCVGDRKCELCEYEPECIVRRVIYSQMRIRPPFMTEGDSIGYVIDCENYKEEFRKGDLLNFDMLLFGRTIVYFGQILQAFQMLGVNGLGKEGTKFRIAQVTNSRRETVMDGRNVFMTRLEATRICDYVSYRIDEGKESAKLVFHTPLTMKCRGEYCREFNIIDILRGAERRIYMLNCYEGIDTERPDTDDFVPVQISQRAKERKVRRYSTTHDQKITLNGIDGEVELSGIRQEAMEFLLAGELVHVGKNTSFGFGRYSVR